MSGDDGERSYVAFVAGRQQALLRSAYLMTGDHHLAEDLVQVALTKLGARWERVRDGDPEAFARTVIYRDNVSWWRKHRRERLHADPPDVRTGDATGDVDSRLLLRTALQRLTPKQRAVVVMRFYDDLSEATTATLLGVSVGTVKSQTHVALRRLREEIGLDLVDTTAGETI